MLITFHVSIPKNLNGWHQLKEAFFLLPLIARNASSKMDVCFGTREHYIYIYFLDQLCYMQIYVHVID